MALSQLPSLTDISDVLNPAGMGQAVGTAIGNAVAPKLGSDNPTLTKYVIIGLGLLLIAAGIFSFDKTRTMIMQASKAAVAA